MILFKSQKSKLTLSTKNFYPCISTNSISSFYLNWVMTKKHWKKNRFMFNLIFLKNYVPLKFLRILENKKKIDLNLVLAWKQLKYINLCSTIIIQKIMNTQKKWYCTDSLLVRPVHTILFIEKKTGCICCNKDLKGKGPVWWNELDRVTNTFRSNMDYFLAMNLYKFSILKGVRFLSKKRRVLLKKLSKILNIFSWPISFLPSLITFSIKFTGILFIKNWKFIY